MFVKESQGYTPTESRSRLIYEFEKEQENEVEEETARSWTFTASPHDVASPVKTMASKIFKPENTPSSNFKNKNNPLNQESTRDQPTRSNKGFSPRLVKPAFVTHNIEKNVMARGFPSSSDTSESAKFTNLENRTLTVQERVAQFDSPRAIPKDPTEMTIRERKALFERNGTKESHSDSNVYSPKTNSSRQSPSHAFKSGASSNFIVGTKEKTTSSANMVLGKIGLNLKVMECFLLLLFFLNFR